MVEYLTAEWGQPNGTAEWDSMGTTEWGQPNKSDLDIENIRLSIAYRLLRLLCFFCSLRVFRWLIT